MITYRKATKDDIDTLIEMRIEFLDKALQMDHKISSQELEKILFDYFSENIPKEEFIAWLAYDDNELVATSGLSFYTLPPTFENVTGRTAYIMNMYTKSDYRRKGIATELFNRLLNEAKDKNINNIVLHASDEGKPLYEKFGFKGDTTEMVLRLKKE